MIKTKDMLNDFSWKTHMSEDTLFNCQTIEYVKSYKYQGTIIDANLKPTVKLCAKRVNSAFNV